MWHFLFALTSVIAQLVPETISQKERLDLFDNLKKFNLSVKYYKDKGLGLETGFEIKMLENILCVPQDLHIRHVDPYPFDEYTSSLSPLERLASRILYEKFQSKKDTFARHYISSLPVDVQNFCNLSEKSLELLNKFSLVRDVKSLFDHSKYYKNIKNALKGLAEINQEIYRDESIEWALRIALTRSVRFLNEKEDVWILIPYLDLTNYWYRPENFTESSLFAHEDMICIRSPFNLNPGDEVLIDYGVYESLYFFTRYLFTVQNNPYDYIPFTYPQKSLPEDKTYNLYACRIEEELLSYIISLVDNSLNFTSDLPKFFKANREQVRAILHSIKEYRRIYKDHTMLSNHPGLRETRRVRPVNQEEKTIIDFALSSRVTIYNHLRAVDQAFLQTAYEDLFSN